MKEYQIYVRDDSNSEWKMIADWSVDYRNIIMQLSALFHDFLHSVSKKNMNEDQIGSQFVEVCKLREKSNGVEEDVPLGFHTLGAGDILLGPKRSLERVYKPTLH